MQRPRLAPNSAIFRSQERGYVLLTLIFFVAVLAISLATILPSIKQEIIRDREEEMIHRGAQYTRAIRLYFKKNGRYPAKIEDLESTNNLRFLRKRYKDPTVKGEDSPEADFKILRFGDPAVHLSQGGQVPPQQGLPGQPGADPNAAVSPKGRARSLSSAGPATPQTDSTDTNQNPDAATQDPNANAAANTGETPPDTASTAQDQGSGGNKSSDKTAYGGGAMVGVASTNANTQYPAIREFNKKRHYNEWQFVYDPQTDRGGLPKGPWQPAQFPGQTDTQKPIGTPADQMSNPVAPPTGNGPNPAPAPNQQQ
jgi:type II secretory pathway pseudopilin PulG